MKTGRLHQIIGDMIPVKSLTTVDFLVPLEKILLNETHVALIASEGSFT